MARSLHLTSMKRLPSLLRPKSKKSSMMNEVVLVLLIAVAFFQIAMCFSATTKLLPPVSHIYSESELQTNAPLVRGVNGATNEKS
jgi:hypothetical protein